MQLKQISRIVVRFSPWTGEARSAREFLARVTSAPAKASNPDCKVETKIRVNSEPSIEIEYENKVVEKLETSKLSITQLLALVQNKAQEMDTAGKLKAAGIGTEKIKSSWLQTPRKESEVGNSAHIPRQQ